MTVTEGRRGFNGDEAPRVIEVCKYMVGFGYVTGLTDRFFKQVCTHNFFRL